MSTELRALVRTADNLGVTLPAKVRDLLDFDAGLVARDRVESESVREILAAAGTKDFRRCAIASWPAWPQRPQVRESPQP
jgi:hypothetical protein